MRHRRLDRRPKGRGQAWLLVVGLVLVGVAVGRDWSASAIQEAPATSIEPTPGVEATVSGGAEHAEPKEETEMKLKGQDAGSVNLAGKVVDESGAGVEGATVRFLAGVGPLARDLKHDRRLVLGERPLVPADGLDPHVQTSTSVTTGAGGRFQIADSLQPGVIAASAPGFTVAVSDSYKEPFPEELTLSLSRTKAAIVGVTKDRQSGMPVPGMRVVAVPAQMAFFPDFDPAYAPSVGVDDDGHFEIVGMPNGSYRLFALSNGATHRSSTSEESVPIEWTGAPAEPVEVLVEPGGVVSLQLFSEQGELTEAWCRLDELAPPGEAGLRRIRRRLERPMTEDGACRFEGLSFGPPHVARIEAPGHVVQEIDVPPPTVASPHQRLRVVLERGFVVRGSARFRDGTPAAGLQVALMRGGDSGDAATPSSRFWPSRLDGDGHFEFTQVPRGPAEVVVGFMGFRTGPRFKPHGGRKIAVQVTADVEDLEVELDGVVLHGRVVDPDGSPVGLAQVALRARPSSRTRFPMGPAVLGAARASSDGHFVLHALEHPDGAWVEAAADGYAPSEPVFPGGGDEELRIELREFARVVGRVVSAREPAAPVSGSVFLKGGHEGRRGRSRFAELGPDGAFELDVPPGDVVLGARVEGHLPPDPIELVLAPGETAEAVFRVQQGATVVGTVVDAVGTALAGAQVDIRLEDFDSASFIPHVVSDGQGRFTFENIPPGQHTISVSHRNHSSPLKVPLSIEADTAPDPLTLRFAATGRVSGTVTQGGRPAVGMQVTLASEGHGQIGGQTLTDDRGRFEMNAVAEGSYEAFAVDVAKMMAQGISFGAPPDRTRPVVVRAGQHTVVELELPGAGGVRLSGTVKGGSDELGFMIGMVIILLPAGASLEGGAEPVGLPALVLPTGDFQLTDIPPGTYTLAIYASGPGAFEDPPKAMHEQRVVVGTEDQRLAIDLPGR